MSTHAPTAEQALFAGSSTPVAKKDKKRKLVTAVALFGAGVAVVVSTLPGTSLATWMAEVAQPGATIQSGVLALASPGAQEFFDTSPDKAAPASIDLATFRIVPGDQISINQAQAVTMVGANLKADWAVNMPVGGALTGALAAPGSGVTGTVYFGQGTYDPATFTPTSALASAPLDGSGAGGVVHFNQPALNGGVAELNDGSLTDGSTKLFAVVVISYDLSASDTTVQATQAEIAGITYSLTQVR